MATDLMTIPDINGDPEDVAKPNQNGRAGAVDSRPIVLSNEDLAAINALGTKLDSLAGFVDGLETLVGSTNTALGSIAGYVDTLETLFGTANTLATSLNGYVDGLETLTGSTNALLTTQNGYLDGVETALGTINTSIGANTVGVGTAGAPNSNVLTIQGIGSMTPLSVTPGALVAGSAIIGKVGIDQTTDGTTNKINIDASLKSGTATRSSVNSGVSSVTILASNANRKGATIINTDANALLLDLSGGTAAATRYQVKLLTDQTHEVAAGYTGAITGIWAADGTGIADVVEFT